MSEYGEVLLAFEAGGFVMPLGILFVMSVTTHLFPGSMAAAFAVGLAVIVPAVVTLGALELRHLRRQRRGYESK